MITLSGQPVGDLVERALVLLMNGRLIVCRSVNHDDHLSVTKRWLAVGQVFQCADKIRFIMARNNYDYP